MKQETKYPNVRISSAAYAKLGEMAKEQRRSIVATLDVILGV